MTSRPTSQESITECPICNEDVKSLKFLQCGHTLCTLCIEALATVQGTKASVKCPNDRSITTYPSGRVNSLKTKFFVKLICENCDSEKLINDCWWCLDCEVSVCSECAMKKHRNHSCNTWENYDVIADCLHFYKSKAPQNVQECMKHKEKITEFCSQLQKLLLQTVDEQEKSFYAIERIENTFGTEATAGIEVAQNNFTKIEKKLNMVSKLLDSVGQCPCLPTAFNNGLCHPVVLPLHEQILSLCVPSVNENITDGAKNLSLVMSKPEFTSKLRADSIAFEPKSFKPINIPPSLSKPVSKLTNSNASICNTFKFPTGGSGVNVFPDFNPNFYFTHPSLHMGSQLMNPYAPLPPSNYCNNCACANGRLNRMLTNSAIPPIYGLPIPSNSFQNQISSVVEQTPLSISTINLSEN